MGLFRYTYFYKHLLPGKMSKSLSRALYDKIFSCFYFNCYSSSLEDLQTQAHKAAITDKTKLMNPIVMTIKAKN